MFRQATDPRYRDLVQRFVDRRMELGLSQEDLCYVAGLADGHINKLESYARLAQFGTLLLWAETLGLEIEIKPVDPPFQTSLAIERRPAPLRIAQPQKSQVA